MEQLITALTFLIKTYTCLAIGVFTLCAGIIATVFVLLLREIFR